MPNLLTTQTVRAPLDRVFAFFSDPVNLEALTPPFLKFRILTPRPIVMREGLLIDYTLRLHGVPVKWQSRITAWEPEAEVRRFVDEQTKGPYRVWVHEHTFRADPADSNSTEVRDSVEYVPPLAWLSDRLFVRPRLEEIFRYRREAIGRLVG